MAYVSRMIAHGETLIGVGHLHWIRVVQGLLWLVGLMTVGFLVEYLFARFLGAIMPTIPLDYGLFQITWIELFCLVAGFYIFCIYFLGYLTSEIALTSERVIYKRGLIFIKIIEVNLEEVKGAHIDTGYLGWLFGYGAVALDARFVKDAKLPFMAKPYRFMAAMTEAQEKLEDHLSLVIEDGPKPTKVHMKHSQKLAGEIKSRKGEDDSEDMPPTLAEEGEQPARPQKHAHEVAEGSYEEEKLKEELSQEWEDHCEDNGSSSSGRTVH